MTTLIIVGVIIAIIVIVGLIFVGMYNGLVTARNRVKEAWSGIDVQLKRRASLVPNLVETVRGYAEHERGTFEAVTRARARLARGTSARARRTVGWPARGEMTTSRPTSRRPSRTVLGRRGPQPGPPVQRH